MMMNVQYIGKCILLHHGTYDKVRLLAGWNSGRVCTDGVAEGIWDAQPPANDGSLRASVVGNSSAGGIEVHYSDAVVYDDGYGAKDVTLWYYGTYQSAVGYETTLPNASKSPLSGKVVGRISYAILKPHIKPTVHFIRGAGESDWSAFGKPRNYHFSWNLNGDRHPHAYIVYTDNGQQSPNNIKTEMGGQGGHKRGDIDGNTQQVNNDFNTGGLIAYIPTSSLSTSPMPMDTVYEASVAIYDKEDSSGTAPYGELGEFRVDERSGNTNVYYGIYGMPTISISVNTNKMIANQPVTIHIKVGKLNKDIYTTSSVRVWVNFNENIFDKFDISNSTGFETDITYTPLQDGTNYTFTAHLFHNSVNPNQTVSNWDYYRTASTSAETYVDPSIDDLSGDTYFSPQDNSTISWSSNKSSEMSQSMSISGSTVSGSYSGSSVTLAPSGNYWVQNIFSNSSRSVAQLNSSVNVTLTHNESGVSTTANISFKVQYQPTKKPSSVSIQNTGQTICIDDYPTTTISWSYPHIAGVAGVVSGYKVRVYSDSNYTNLVSTKDISTTYLQSSMSVSLNNETDLKRGVLNYVTITPYYLYPSGGTKLEGESSAVYYGTLIKPYKEMGPITINYPINNTTWHNKQFRVLFTLPEDRDYDTYTSAIQSNYDYSNIQIDVNGTVYEYSTTYTSGTAHPEIFSKNPHLTNNTTASQKKMAINPSLVSSFADANSFTIKVRVQRGNYYFTAAEMSNSSIKTWSQWATVTLNKTALTEQNLTVGLEIDDTHYMYPHNGINRLLACYPIGSNDNRNIDRARGDLICRSEYQGIYQTMINLINGVNGWCTYDRANVKFNKDIPSFTAIVEIITSAKTGTDRYDSTGRNYMNLLTEYMNNCLQ